MKDAPIDPNSHLQPPRKRQKVGEQHIAFWADIDDKEADVPAEHREEEKKESLELEINRYLNIPPLSWFCFETHSLLSTTSLILSVFSFLCLLFFLVVVQE